MLDIVEIIAAIIILLAGSGYFYSRAIVVCGIAISSASGIAAEKLGVMEMIDPEIFYFNMVLFLISCALLLIRPDKHTVKLCIPMLAISIICLCVYIEYYTESSYFYDSYSQLMLIITGWQILQLLRIGNAGGNIKRRLARFSSDRWGNFLNSDNRHDTLCSRNYAGSSDGRRG